MDKKRILFGAAYSKIEPLGLLHLGGLARDEGWERQYQLIKNHDFEPFFEKIKEFKPNIVGFNIYTGNHLQLFGAYKRLKKDHPNIQTMIGGPHATYFPSESLKYGDYIVMSEGFGSLRKILKGDIKPGIITQDSKEKFPLPDRATFYEEHHEHRDSYIKSFITMTGCPYKCTYCYNSSEPKDIQAPPEIIQKLEQGLLLPVISNKEEGCGSSRGDSNETKDYKLNKLGYGRLFPFNVRSIDDVIAETREIAEKWPTEILYCQDDVHGFDTKDWLPEFAERYPKEAGIPYHAQIRWEMTKDKKRLDLLRDAGCLGLTLAIEAADPIIRKEVLDRGMPEELMFEGMEYLIKNDFKIRTEQIMGLPYGATTKPTKMNLEADLELVELNVKLREISGGPTMAWSSTLAPYSGTKLGLYAMENGHYEELALNNDVPDTFFEKSVLRFPKEWVGPKLKEIKNDEGVWLDESSLDKYREQNAELRRIFNFVTLVPEGDKLAETYLKSNQDFSYDRLGRETIEHLEKLSGKNTDARKMLSSISRAKKLINEQLSNGSTIEGFDELAPCFACIPSFEKAIEKTAEYARENKNVLDPRVFSTAVRHHLYENVLYSIKETPRSNETIVERYPPKL